MPERHITGTVTIDYDPRKHHWRIHPYTGHGITTPTYQTARLVVERVWPHATLQHTARAIHTRDKETQ